MCISCPGGPDVFLPATEISRPQKRERLPHPFQGVIGISNGKRYTRNKKRKDLPTEQLSSLDFTKEIETYLTSLSRADCCVSVQGEPRKCKCFSFLADKLSIIKVVACGLKKYFDLDDSTRKFVLTSEERYANRLTGSSLKYQLPIFCGQITGDDDFVRRQQHSHHVQTTGVSRRDRRGVQSPSNQQVKKDLRWSHVGRPGGGHREPAALFRQAPRPWSNRRKSERVR